MTIRSRNAFGLILLVLACATAAHAQTASWPQLGYNSGHTGYNASELVITRKNVKALANIGSFSVNAEMKSPVIYKGAIYIRSLDGNVYAFVLASGRLKWSVAVALPGAGSSDDIAIADNHLIVTCFVTSTPGPTSGICALDPKTGSVLWTYAISYGGPFTAPVIAGGTVYLGQSGVQPDGNGTGAIVAVNLFNGKERWRFWSCAPGPVCMKLGSGVPAVDGGLVYFGCSGGPQYAAKVIGTCALNATTGALVWNAQIGDPTWGDWQGRLVARKGTLYEAYQTANCYNCGYTIDIVALNETSGATLWDTPITSQLVNSFYPTGAPTLGQTGTAYQAISTSNNANQPNLFAVDATGTIAWRLSTIQNLGNTATVVGGGAKQVLFYACFGNGTQGTTCAYNPHNGSLLWTSSDQNLASRFAPVVAGGVVYNDCNSNSVCAYAPH